MLIRGQCHCGNIAFTLTWEPDPTEIPARVCTCSFCSKHAARWTSSPDADLRVVVRDPARVSRYAFGTESAEFQICAACGVVPLVTSRIDDKLYAVVSVNAFEGVDPALLRAVCSNVEGEDLPSRLARRKRHWIGKVTWGPTSA